MFEGLTSRARDFVRKNRTAKVVSGAWLDERGRVATGGPATWVRLRYRFDDGTSFSLRKADLASMNAAGHSPIWREESPQ